MLGSGWGGLDGGKAVVARERVVAGGESSSPRSAVLCCVFSLSVSLLLVLPLFTILLNCPYPDPPVFACFCLFPSAPQRGEGRQGDRVALLLPATAKL